MAVAARRQAAWPFAISVIAITVGRTLLIDSGNAHVMARGAREDCHVNDHDNSSGF
jgi:hypothetical protein